MEKIPVESGRVAGEQSGIAMRIIFLDKLPVFQVTVIVH